MHGSITSPKPRSAYAVAPPASASCWSTTTAGRRSQPAARSACARTEQHAEVVRDRRGLPQRIEQHTSLAAPVEQEDVERVVGIRAAGPDGCDVVQAPDALERCPRPGEIVELRGQAVRANVRADGRSRVAFRIDRDGERD